MDIFVPLMILIDGAVAQLGERVNGIHEVRGSIPLSSTSSVFFLPNLPALKQLKFS